MAHGCVAHAFGAFAVVRGVMARELIWFLPNFRPTYYGRSFLLTCPLPSSPLLGTAMSEEGWSSDVVSFRFVSFPSCSLFLVPRSFRVVFCLSCVR